MSALNPRLRNFLCSFALTLVLQLPIYSQQDYYYPYYPDREGNHYYPYYPKSENKKDERSVEKYDEISIEDEC